MRKVWGCIPASSAATDMTNTARFCARSLIGAPSCQVRLEVGTDVLVVVGRQLLQQLLLLLGEPVGDLDLHSGEQISGASPAGVEPLALDPEDPTARRARRDLDLDRTVHRGNRDAGPQSRLGVGDRDRDGQVVATASEQGMGGHMHVDQQVSGRPAVAARCSLARDPDRGTVLDAGGDAHTDRTRPHLCPGAPANGAGLVDDHARTSALRACFGEREEALVAGHRARASTGGAGLGPAGWLHPGPAAMRAGGLPPNLQGRGDTAERLLERDGQVGTGVGAADRYGGPSGSAGEDVAESAQPPEEVAQVLDADLLAAESAESSGSARRPTSEPRGDETTDLVVLLPLLRIREHRIRLRDGLEPLLGFRVTRVGVRVEFLGELAIGALDLVLAGIGRHLQDGVEVLLHPIAVHCSSSSSLSFSSGFSRSFSYSSATRAGRINRSFRRYPRLSSSFTTRRPAPSLGAITASWISGSKGSPTDGTTSSP